ncbi:hypothetical protein ISG33_01790 [Glaciecola sp. MH2013]|uniref:hypothetical protein n=1 Tax=Glaciecola sp. MH2013 TaxID=2785524 RepID=UPI00189E8CD2|nr:hypothetical protein [Glaciecola sp. MH2013]MBF7072132.1 hypothetical protein [Glaciecola sp. MH2013]
MALASSQANLNSSQIESNKQSNIESNIKSNEAQGLGLDVEKQQEQSKQRVQALKVQLAEANARYSQLQKKYALANQALERQGRISPRQLTEYLPAPFDLLVSNYDEKAFAEFETFYRADDNNPITQDYERLISALFDDSVNEHFVLKKVDCKLSVCHIYFLASNTQSAQYLQHATAYLLEQEWAANFILAGYRSFLESANEKQLIAFVYSYRVPDNSGASINE